MKQIDFSNEILCDVVKFWMAIEGDTCVGGFYSQKYVLEKLRQIIERKCNWHSRINEVFDQTSD